jgi:hypothetical protein
LFWVNVHKNNYFPQPTKKGGRQEGKNAANLRLYAAVLGANTRFAPTIALTHSHSTFVRPFMQRSTVGVNLVFTPSDFIRSGQAKKRGQANLPPVLKVIASYFT